MASSVRLVNFGWISTALGPFADELFEAFGRRDQRDLLIRLEPQLSEEPRPLVSHHVRDRDRGIHHGMGDGLLERAGGVFPLDEDDVGQFLADPLQLFGRPAGEHDGKVPRRRALPQHAGDRLPVGRFTVEIDQHGRGRELLEMRDQPGNLEGRAIDFEAASGQRLDTLAGRILVPTDQPDQHYLRRPKLRPGLERGMDGRDGAGR